MSTVKISFFSRSHKTVVPVVTKVFLTFFFLMMEGSEQIITDPDPGEPKTYGSNGYGSPKTGTGT